MLLLQCLFGAVVASLVLGVFLLTRLGDKKQSRDGNAGAPNVSMLATANSRESADCIIVGAGVAGAALAYTLGKAGRRVHVIERDLTEPHGIVGEFLQPGGYLKLAELDLEDCVEEIDAQRIDKYILLKDGQYSDLPFPLEKYDSQVAGRGFHNGRFVQRLREKASSLPNVCMEEGTVTSLFEEKGVVKGVFYRSKYVDQLQARAPLTIVCDGCFSNLRRALCSSKVKVPSSFAGLILENYKLPFSNSGVLILANPSPILFYPISSTEVRCLVDLPGQELPSIATGEMSNYLKFLVLPEIPTELHDAFIAAVDKGKIRTMPSRSMLANPIPTPGAFLLGDAFNMRHPLTGGGMTVALSDVAVLQKLLEPLHDLHDASYICKKLEAFYTLRKPVASPINILADLMHTVFSSLPGQARSEIEQSYVDYLRLGGTCSTGLMGLISGLNPSPWSLVAHFISVTVFGVGRLMLPFPSPKRMWIAARLIASACGLIFPIMKAEGVRQMFFPATVPAYYRAPPGQ